MAKGRIPIYEQQTNVANVPGSPHVTGEMAGAGIGRAVLGLGNDLGAAASIMSAREREAERVLQERDDNVSNSQAAVGFANASTEFDKLELGMQQQTRDDPNGFAGRIGEAWGQVRDKALEGITNERARQWAEVHYAQAGAQRMRTAMVWEAARAGQYDDGEFRRVTKDFAGSVAADASRFVEKMTVLDMMRTTGRYTSEHGTQLFSAAEQSLADASVTGRVERDAVGTLPLLDRRLGIRTKGAEAPEGLSSAQLAAWNADLPAAQRTLIDAERTPTERAALEAAFRDSAAGVKDIRRRGGDFEERGDEGKTGVPDIDALSVQQVETLRNRAITRIQQGQSSEKASVERRDR